MAETARIEALIAPSLEAMGYKLVRVAFTGGHSAVLQVMAERADLQPMSMNDCSEITHAVSALLDVADPIAQSYVLEVTSPGIDRPLLRAEDYERFRGFEAKVELQRPMGGRRRFRGRILGFAEGRVRLSLGAEEVELPLADVQRAKLVLTDDLIAATETRN
ncbi:MAG TPA: ribosome maturation factor RimP [Stellaceae bacterium]|nr:ribosome maturation factor RimP [Stellaceae bacterium]